MKQVLTSVGQATSLLQAIWPRVKETLATGQHLVLEIKKPPKSRDTEKKYHAMIGEIAEQAMHMGAKWSAEDWKRLLVDQFLRDNKFGPTAVVPNLDMTGIVQLGFQTRNFTQEQASEFVEWLNAWGANNGIVFSQDSQ